MQYSLTSIEDLYQTVYRSEQALALSLDHSKKNSLRAFSGSFKDVKRSICNVVRLHVKRQKFLELHCNDAGISLDVHEKYHLVSNDLQSEMRSFLTIYKTCLNSVALLLKELTSEVDRRGLRFKSFGSLIDSLDKSMTDKKLQGLIAILKSRGTMVDKQIVPYRDHMIEHPSKLDRGFVSSTPDSVRIIHQRENEGADYYSVASKSDASPQLDIFPLKLLIDDGSYLYYYHLKSSGTSRIVEEGETLGEVADDTGVHFSKHGSHLHVFSSSTFKGDVLGSIWQTTAGRVESPDPVSAWKELASFITEILVELRNVI